MAIAMKYLHDGWSQNWWHRRLQHQGTTCISTSTYGHITRKKKEEFQQCQEGMKSVVWIQDIDKSNTKNILFVPLFLLFDKIRGDVVVE